MTAISGIRGSLVHVRTLATYVRQPVIVQQHKVDAKIQKLIETEKIEDISKFINARIIPYDSAKEVRARPVHQNDFILACIRNENIEMIKKLTENDLGPIPERLVRNENDISARLIGSNNPDPLLSAIFLGQMIIVEYFHKTCPQYSFEKNYNFPLRTLSRRVEIIENHEPCHVEISPLTVALMMPVNMNDTRRKVEKLLELNAKKRILPFAHAFPFNNHRELELFNRKLEGYRINYETFLKKCF